MAVEDAAIEFEPGLFVEAGPEGADEDVVRGLDMRKRAHVAVQVHELAHRPKAGFLRGTGAQGRVVVSPEVDSLRILTASGFYNSHEKAATDAESAALGMDDDLARGPALFAGREREGVGVAGEAVAVEDQDGVREVIAALDAQELVLAEGLMTVGEGGGADERLEFGQHLIAQTRGGLNSGHGQIHHGVSARRAFRGSISPLIVVAISCT